MATITNNLRLKLKRRKESFRAKEKPMASQKMNAFIFWSVQRFSLCAVQHSAPAKLAARKRWAAVLFLAASVAFTATNAGFLLLF